MYTTYVKMLTNFPWYRK